MGRRLARFRALAPLAVVLLAAGCGTSEHDQVQAKVQQFLHATEKHDYATICDQVLAPTLLEHLAAGGIPCRTALQIALGAVQSPLLSIGRITVDGAQASAITLTAATGQLASVDAIELIKTGQGWRIQSLGTPVLPKGKG